MGCDEKWHFVNGSVSVVNIDVDILHFSGYQQNVDVNIFILKLYPPASEASREVENIFARK